MFVYILFVFGFILLIKGGDSLVEGASSIAKRYGVSDLIVGLTVVSFGTSAPELIVNIISSLSGASDIAIGNVLGSNVANILLIVGITAILCELPLSRDTLLSEIPFSLMAIFLVGFLANASLVKGEALETISRLDGAILMFFFALFILYVFYVAFEDKKKAKELAESIHKRIDGDVSEGDLTIESDKISNGRAWFLIIVGIIGLFIGGKWVVDGAVAIARAFGLTERLIGLTVIAIGTSLPELVTSIIAAKNKAVDIAVGNAIGSNIFNLLWILGVSSLVKPLPFKVVNNADIIVLMIASCLLILSLATGKKRAIDRNDGILFVSLYIAYLVFCIYRG